MKAPTTPQKKGCDENKKERKKKTKKKQQQLLCKKFCGDRKEKLYKAVSEERLNQF